MAKRNFEVYTLLSFKDTMSKYKLFRRSLFSNSKLEITKDD